MSFVYAGQYTEAVLGRGASGTGTFLQSAMAVNVYQVGTTTPVTLYTDRTKGTTTANPVNTDAGGNLTFYADPGHCDLVFTPAGGTSQRVSIVVPVDPGELSAAYSAIPATAESVRYVSPNGSDANNGRTPGAAFATLTAADADFAANSITGGVIVLSPGTLTTGKAALTNTRRLAGAGAGVTTLTLTAGQTGTALSSSVAGFALSGFTLSCAASSGTLTAGIGATVSSGSVDDVVVNGAPTGISGSNCGSLQVGVRAKVQIQNPTVHGIDINADGGAEITIGTVDVTRLAAGSFTSGLHITRTAATDVGGFYITALHVTKGSGTYSYGIQATSTAANTAMPLFILADVVCDSAGITALSTTNISNVKCGGGWFTMDAGSNGYAVTVSGGGSHTYSACTCQGDGTGGFFDLSAGTTNPHLFNNQGSAGTFVKVASATPPTGIKYSGNGGYATLTNDYATLAAAVNLTDVSGMTVWTHSTAGGGVLNLQNSDGASRLSKFIRVDTAGKLHILNSAFSGDVFSVDDSGVGVFAGACYANEFAWNSPRTQTTVGAAGAATALPAQPLGYLIVSISGTDRKVPYYNT